MLAIIMVNAGGRHCGVQVQLSSHVRHDDKREKTAKPKTRRQIARYRNHAVRLTEEAVYDIRAMADAGASLKEIGEKHGLSISHVSGIKLRKFFTWLPERNAKS